MKKITLSLVFLLTMVMGSYGQVTVGEGTDTAQVLPFNAYYGYTYSQSIYLASEINANGSITSIQWYFTGTGALPNSQNLTIYLGQTTKTTFDSDLDYIAVGELTSVYTGGIVTGSTAGWKTITFTTPFPYDGISNLVVAVDENMANYDGSADDFRNTNVGSNRSIYVFDDTMNADPANPTVDSSGYPQRGMVQFVPNIIFGGISQACGNPTDISASLATTTQATIAWTATAGQTDWEVYVVEQSMPAPTPSTVGTPVTGTASYVKTGLLSNTGYNAYVRAKCSPTLFSGWSGPKNFRTLCDPFGDFNENLDELTAATGVVPNCWTKTIVSANTNVNVSVIDYTASSTPNALYMTNSADETAGIYLATPALTAIGANTHRMKFKARGGVTGQVVTVGTMSDPTDASTFVELQSITLTNAYMDYNVTLNTSSTANHIAFKHGLGGTYRNVYLDDIVWEPIPTMPPGCIQDMNAVPNEGCGNFATLFTWSAVPGADGYKVSIGTSPNGQDLVVDNVDIFSALSYSFMGNPMTDYYYTIVPYNANASATGCFEDFFQTYGDGCYCESVPTSNDGAGISSVQINNVVTPVADVMYASFIENGAIDITQGVNTIMNVSLATGAGYFTNVWVDFNDNYNFEPSELVYTGESGSANPFVLNTSFIAPITAGLGEHRLRIGATDYLQTPPNPCFGAAWGVTLDFLVNVLEAPTCLPPSASTTSNITATTATVNWVSDATLFNIEVDFAGFTQGTGVVTSGIVANTTILENLDPQQDYAYYLQTDCGSGSESPWTGPFTFRTGCNAFGDFTEDFTTEVNYVKPECWYSSVTASNTFANINVYSYNDYVQFYNSDDTAASMYMITPALTDLPLATHRVKFKAYGTAGSSMIVGTMSDPSDPSTFVPKQTIPMTTAFANYSVSFLDANTASHVAFKPLFTDTYQYVYLDDVAWETAPTCPDVNVILFDGATPYTADISWTPGGNETSWEYVVGSSTDTDPTTLIAVPVAGPDAMTTIPDLLPSTTYKVWVRATCGTSVGSYSEAITFVTACIPVTDFPWTEGFENTTGSAFPPCWSKENGDWVTSAANAYVLPRSGTRYLRDSYAATNEYMWTPGFELTAGVSYDFSFYMAGDGYDGWAVDVYQNTVQNSAGATQIGTTINASGVGSSYVIQSYALVTNTIVPTTTGVYYFAVKVNQPGFPWYIGFDDFRLEPTPTCIAPLSPTIADVTVSTATMNWVETTPAPANGYDYYVTTATTAPNAATVPTGTVVTGVTTADLTSLSSSTVYRAYVRSICGTDEFSSWSDAGMFTTPCAAFDAPFMQDFTAYVPLCWSTAAAGTVATGPTGSAAGIWGVDGFLNVGTTGAVKVNLYNVNRIGWLITPMMNTTVGEVYTLSFDYGVTTWNATTAIPMGSDDFVKIAMTIDNGVTWTELQSITAADNVSNMSQEFTYEFTATTAEAKFALIASDGTVDDDQDYDFFVDNLALETSLSNNVFDNNSFTAYPNPVKDMLNVSFTQNISNVTVYNLLGQQVLFMNMNASKGQVDMSNLATGTYLVKVSTENAVKTIKVIKE